MPHQHQHQHQHQQRIVRRNVKRGDDGTAVKYLQRGLQLHPDGKFGRGTERVLRRWQKHQKLAATGRTDGRVWHRLGYELRLPFTQVLKRGSKGKQVKRLQQLLKVSPADGVFGQGTKRAVQKFQQRRRLKPDGVVGGKVYERLGYTYHPPAAAGGQVLAAPGVDLRHVDRELMRRAKKASAFMKLPILVKSGFRSNREQCQAVWRMHHGGPLAAPCNPCRSNHCRGKALDMGFVRAGRYTSFMQFPGALAAARHAKLKFPMWPPWGRRIEAWHAEKA